MRTSQNYQSRLDRNTSLAARISNGARMATGARIASTPALRAMEVAMECEPGEFVTVRPGAASRAHWSRPLESRGLEDSPARPGAKDELADAVVKIMGLR